jgi:hypothetical protein
MTNTRKRGGQTIHHDKCGDEYVLDEDGNRQTPRQSRRVSRPGEFPTYDTSEGHCALCGRLGCRGGCFK